MAHTVFAPLAGASLLALALPAAAQDHSHHQTPAQADPHAGHDMSLMQHDNHDDNHSAATSPLGAWPMTRDASGTSWQPDLSRHGGVHWNRGAWSFMSHAQINLVHDWQNGPRGDDKTFVSGMIMGSARRDFADGSTLNLRAMLSPDPLMGKEGFPLLLAAGETADGVNPLIDRQHPHELVMELSASYSRRLTEKDTLYAYLGLPGEPAFGPPAFMHRMSAMDSPEAPITHHWLDSTHIVFGVATLGWAHDAFKLESSAFRGREPDQDRYDIERPELDSWSVRASWNPSPEWSLQASWADVTAPEQLEPDEDETKWSASAIHTRPFGADGWHSATLAWGRKTNDHGESKVAWLLEGAISPDDRWTLFARAERIETDELVPGVGGGHGDLYTVSKASLGAVHDWRIAPNVRFGLGALYSLNQVPGPLEPLYGGDPDGGMIFARIKVQ
ncbi:hypothetical protein GCM10009422_23430 [Brevundimonas kwangchunensis]|uniref:Porin n=1 Tax=Brevundimonas kwangchunensis TaxID=322163 RepID=A0ABN1H174_9CAUL